MGLDDIFTGMANEPIHENDIITRLMTPLKEVDEPEESQDIDDRANYDEPEEKEINGEEIEKEDKRELKKRFERFNQRGAKGIVKLLDIGNANLCRKLSYSDDAAQFRADKEDLEDLEEVFQDILPKKSGEEIRIPVWLQLIIYLLLAFAPAIISALTDRGDNKEMKRLQKEVEMLKKERELQKLRDELAKEQPDEKKIDEIMINVVNGNGVKTDEEVQQEENDED